MSGTIAVTGAFGFIGGHLVSRLLEEGFRVKALTRRPTASLEDIPGVIYVTGHLRDDQALGKLLEDVEGVFHLAAEIRDEMLMEEVNVEGTRRLLKAILSRRIRKSIFLSSAGVIGQGDVFRIDEDMSCTPGNRYEQTKWEAESLVKDFASSEGLSVGILRPTNVFGEGKSSREDSFYALLRCVRDRRFFLINGGRGWANYIYVADVAEALLSMYKDDRGGQQLYILNDGISMKELFAFMSEATRVCYRPWSLPMEPVLFGSRILTFLVPGFPLTPSRVMAMHSPYSYKSDRIQEELGYRPRYGVRQGLLRTARWLATKGWL